MKHLAFRAAIYFMALFVMALMIWLIKPGLIHTITSNDDATVAQLPLVELRAETENNDMFAIILSGDGGWADLDRDFGNAFQKHGLSTVGFDCLKYFWKPRHPAEASQDLEVIIRHYSEHWGKKRVLLVGFSFGANWLPFMVNRLPSDLQKQVHQVVLLAPSEPANLEIKMGDWLKDVSRPGALTVTPEAERIKLPLLCVYGIEEEQKSVCTQLQNPKLQILRMPGGHHFDNQYSIIEDTILHGITSK